MATLRRLSCALQVHHVVDHHVVDHREDDSAAEIRTIAAEGADILAPRWCLA
ncbi:hypothetical protein [Nocardia brasiliensis]|uniref:hypothetical protein n=1 Tax=Nocardia brasiliensis TaxID=37326 RepID=UPI002457CEB0|nr:hypothetical protein [Nocardia brasiliensis]